MMSLRTRSLAPASKRWMAVMAAVLLSACSQVPKDRTSDWSADKLYAEAREESAAGNVEKALEHYEKLEGRAAGQLLAQQAQLERAYLLYKTGDRPQALAVVERYIRFNPSSPALDYAWYLQGLIHFNDNMGLLGQFTNQDLAERDQQASKDAFQAFKQLVDQYPQSPYAADARLRMGYILNALAAYEVHVARYYYRRGAYVAAVARAQQAVADYQQAPAVEEALALMMHSYKHLNLPQLHEDTRRVLAQNFPQSRYLESDQFETRARKWWQLW